MHELLPPTCVASLGALLFIVRSVYQKDIKATKVMLKAGLIVCIADLIIELIGTHTEAWTYHVSHLFVFKTVPIELPILFSSSGVWLGGLYLWIKRSQRQLSLDLCLLTITTLALLICGLSYIGDQPLRMIVFTIPFGFWGFSKLKTEERQALSVIIASLAAVADWFIETWAVGSGNYGYREGFTVETPLTYALLTLGFMGLLEVLETEPTESVE